MSNFIFFQDVLITKGSLYSILIDTQKEKYLRIINDILWKFIKEDKRTYKINESNKIFFYKLVELDYGYLSDEKNELKKDFIYLNPKLITNIIVDIDNNFEFEKIIKKIVDINPESIMIRINSYDFTTIEKIIQLVKFSGIRCIDLKINIDNPIKLLKFIKTILNERRFRFIELYNTNRDNYLANFDTDQNFIFYKNKLDLTAHCNIIDTTIFNTNLKFINESLHKNNCLNGKLYISIEGNMKNCPYSIPVYGNILKDDFNEKINSNEFKYLGDITKDKIEICKDCEFRYICTDCRVYTENNQKSSKPKYCKYNPYRGIWEK